MYYYLKLTLSCLFILFLSFFSFAQSYSEGGDLPNSSAGAPAFSVSGPSITVSGQMNTPGDGQEYFQVIVPAGCQITGVDYSITDPANLSISGFFHFNTNNDVSFSGASSGSFPSATQFPSTSFPVGPGTYDCYVIANIAYNSAWTMKFNTSCSVVPCASPSVPTVTSSPSTICLGGSATLNISGSLNDATSWNIYSGSCGGTLVGTTTGSTFVVSPGASTTYYVRGEGGCVTPGSCGSTTVNVSSPSISSASQSNILCNSGNNGAATVTAATGGIGGYSYNWTPGNPTGDGTTSISGLSAGTYTCTVTDGNSCTASQSFTITEPTVLAMTASSQTNVTCNGGSTGVATVNAATGGAGSYTYDWTPGNPTGDGTTSISGLSAGTYVCTVTDGNSCTASQSFTITESSAIVLTAAAQNNVLCNGGSTGSASVNPATNGAGSYTYDWTPGTPTGDGTTSISGLAAGTYVCTVTDANSCTTSQSFTITEPTVLAMSTSSQTNVLCNGALTGVATVNAATGGAGSYTYDWTPGTPTGDGTTSISGLAVGTYVCTVTDANSCTASQSFTITEPTVLAMSTLSQTNVLCNGALTGTASVSAATGGAGSYTYDWTPGNPTGDGTTSISGLSAGTYVCTVTDANSCTTSQSFTITEPTVLAMSTLSQTNVLCNGASTGIATVNAATGGAGSYTYDWTPGNPTGDGTTSISGLAAGTYVCTATDANSCTTSQSFTITEPTVLAMSTLSQTNVLCNGASTGVATVNASTGGAGSYTYDWTPGTPTGDGTTSISGLAAGTYVCTVTDANSCSTSQSFTITEPTVLTLTTSSQTNVLCNGDANGIATVNGATGGAGSYTYDWTPGTPTGDGTTSITGLVVGTYVCTVTDANSCTTSQSFTITEPNVLTLSATAQTNVLCNGGSSGSATVSGTGGTGAYAYSWSPSGGSSATANGLSAGTYVVTVTDVNNCSETQSFTITEPPILVVSDAGQSNVSCFGGSDGTATVSAVGGTNVYTYSWLPSGGALATASGLSAGTYVCTVTDGNNCTATQSFVITQANLIESSIADSACDSYELNGDFFTTSGTYVQTISAANGCDSVITLNLVIYSNPASPDVVNETYCIGETKGTLTATGSTGVYEWYSDDQLTDLLSNTDVLNLNEKLGETSFYVIAISSDGCKSIPSEPIATFVECELVIPTAITPKSTPNNTWEIVNLDVLYPNNQIVIYDRLGNTVFSFNASPSNLYSENEWDGTKQGDELPVATYFYVIKFNDGSNDGAKGSISIVRN